MPDCQDKKSTHYFMCHMTQEEWTNIIQDSFPYGKLQNHTFNKIKSPSEHSPNS